MFTNEAYVTDITYIWTGTGWLSGDSVRPIFAQAGWFGNGTQYAGQPRLPSLTNGDLAA